MRLQFTLNLLVVAAAAFIFSSCNEEHVPKISFSIAVFAYDVQTEQNELTTSQLAVKGDGKLYILDSLESEITTIDVKGGLTTYTVTVTKAGYKTYEHDFTADELKAFTHSSPLNVELEPGLSFSVNVFAYNAVTKNYEATTATMVVTSAAGTLYDDELQAETTTVDIQNELPIYLVVITKEGYDTYQADFSETELQAFVPGSPLEINLFLSSIDDGLVAWYRFGGNAQDASGNGLHGTVTGATLTTDKEGAANSAYQFNGTSYINIPSASLKLNVYTYSVWVNASSIPSTGNTGNVFSMGDDATTKHQSINVSNSYGSALATGWCVGGWNNGATANSGVNSNVLPTPGQWYHVVMVRSADAVTMYLNNELIGSSTTDGFAPFYGTSNTANIGMRSNQTQGFNGKVDNFRIYNRALSASEIGNIFYKE